MKKMYQTPEIEIFVNEEFCQYEGKSDNGGEAPPLGNENKTFDENDIVKDVTTPATLWDE